MSASTPPPEASANLSHNGSPRPRFVTFALIVAFLFGAGCWSAGCARIAYYRDRYDHVDKVTQGIKDTADQERVAALYIKFADESDRFRSRLLPLSIATFVVGAALMAFASRAVRRRTQTRSLIVQLSAAQAILVLASYAAARPVFDAEADWQYETAMVFQRERMDPHEFDQALPMLRGMRRMLPPAWLTFRSLASVLVIYVLMRPRVRAYFDEAESEDERTV
jgi:hypothetical protein